jgi:hypothetical protein
MLESGVETCPPAGGACARPPEAASNALINTRNDQEHRGAMSRHPEITFI